MFASFYMVSTKWKSQGKVEKSGNLILSGKVREFHLSLGKMCFVCIYAFWGDGYEPLRSDDFQEDQEEEDQEEEDQEEEDQD